GRRRERRVRRPAARPRLEGRAGDDQEVRGGAGSPLQGRPAPARPQGPATEAQGRGGGSGGGAGRAEAFPLAAGGDQGADHQGLAREGGSEEARRWSRRRREAAAEGGPDRPAAAGARLLERLVLRRSPP